MAVELNHTIVAASDAAASATWYAELFRLAAPIRYGPFWQVSTSNGVNLDFQTVEAGAQISPQHYAFLIGDDDFDEIFGGVVERGMSYFADPFATRRGEINHNDGGRGVYFPDPDGHWLEIITRPYGSS
ncbi:MAG: VOC family protein [Candidatus Nanopelagicales bacterium]